MPALLNVTYTPNYVGNHRICFRTTQPSYCCYTDDSFSVIGTPKTIVIDLDEFETCLQDLPAQVGCEGSTVDGYIQPFCVDQGSDLNRVLFTAAFPSEPCTPYGIECEESGIGQIGIINAGYGWPIGVVPTVTVNTSGSGFGFLATVTMECLPGDNFCSIDDILIDQPGEEYFYIDQLSVDVSPLPSCVSDELLIDGTFDNGLLDWNIIPPVDGWLLTPGLIPYYNIPVYSSTGGTIEQSVLTPGRTYLIDFEKVTVQARSGVVRFIVTAGLFSVTGTASNQYMITINSGDPDFDGPLSITLTCFGSNVFSIYADSLTTDPLNLARLTAVSVVELCEAVNPELEVASLDGCGPFIVPNCDGSDNPVQYEIRGTPQYAINVCSGGVGPSATLGKLNITPNPTYGGLGSELVVNGDFTTDLNGWIPDGSSSVLWSSNYGGSANFGASDSLSIISQDILTVGQTYTVNIDLSIIFNSTPGWCSPTSQGYTQFNVYAGTAVYGPLNFSGSESFTFDITCTDNPTFKIEAWDPDGCTFDETANIAQMFCSYVSVKELGTPIPVSCCDCVKYDVINTDIIETPIDFYYTSCEDQSIVSGSIPSQETIQVCAVRLSIWPAATKDNEFLEIVLSGTQDC